MSNNIQLLLRDRLIKIACVVSLVAMLITTVLIIFFYPKFNPYIPLLNSLPWGTARLVANYYIFILPFSFLIVFVLNYALCLKLYSKHVLLSRILSTNTLLFIIFGLLAFVQIAFLIF